jgi:hypothetical protein
MIPMVHQEDHLTCLNDLNVGPFTLQPQLHSQRFFCELGIFLQSARANALANAKHIAQNVAISIDLYIIDLKGFSLAIQKTRAVVVHMHSRQVVARKGRAHVWLAARNCIVQAVFLTLCDLSAGFKNRHLQASAGLHF